MAYLFKADAQLLNDAALREFSTVPFILSNGFEYLDEANRFLRERATGRWHPLRGFIWLRLCQHRRQTIQSLPTVATSKISSPISKR